MPCPCCCSDCTTPCCEEENPVTGGVCCDGVWQTGAGICCGGVWQTGSGTCCGGEWYTVAGDCCQDVWYPASAPCAPDQVYVEWGPNGACCGCVPETIYDGREGTSVYVEDLPESDFCCNCDGTLTLKYSDEDGSLVGCLGRCCDGQDCTQTLEGDCEHEWHPGCCEEGCPAACCSETTDGIVTCAVTGSLLCVAPSVLADPDDCATGCLGACCEDGVYIAQTTQGACTGCWGGVGSTTCLSGCREPFTSGCCESAQSTAALLTFTQPRFKRCPPFAETLRVTVTGHTDSPILIHGTPFGTSGKRCAFNHSFLICWDKFNIEPVPCGTDFIDLDVTVCWEEEATDAETLNFSGCNEPNGLTVWLGGCNYGCVTTLVYAGAGHTSDVNVQLYGNGVIEASGTGALELTSNITVWDDCVQTLTLTGTSTADNEISGVIKDSAPNGLSVIKTGSGRWLLSANNEFTQRLHVKSGTLVVAASVGASGNSPIGAGGTNATMPLIGDTTSGASFLLNGVTMSRGDWTVAAGTGVVAIGGVGSGTSTFSATYTTRLGRDVTFQAGSGGTVNFRNDWRDLSGGTSPAVAVTVGSTGNDGVVVLGSDLPNSITAVTVVTGTLKIDQSERIGPTTPFTIQTATFDRNGFDQTIDDLAVTGTATLAGTGNITVNATLSGAGDIVNSDGTLTIDGTNTLSGDISITGGSVVVNQIVSGPAVVNSATFTNTTLAVDFSSAPTTGDQFQLLAGSTTQTYTPTLTGTTGGASATYDAATATVTIT